jgi:hypothetical protein
MTPGAAGEKLIIVCVGSDLGSGTTSAGGV